MHDLNGDGICELVLLDLTTVFTSPSDLVETALSRGMECSLKIRALPHGAFSRNLDASVTVRLLFVLEDLTAWPFCVQGDFNSDDRPALLIRRSEHEWNIYYSTRDDSAWLNQVLQQAGFRVSAVVPKQRTLKEFFLSITGDKAHA